MEAGLAVLAGVVPATVPEVLDDAEPAGAGQPSSARQTAERVVEVWRRMGWPAAEDDPGNLAAQVVLTPA